jgi:LPXTG-site transpeptidase (sortase) family protein
LVNEAIHIDEFTNHQSAKAGEGMINTSGIIYTYEEYLGNGETVTLPIEVTPDNLEELVNHTQDAHEHSPIISTRSIGIGLLLMALGGILAVNATKIRLDVAYKTHEAKLAINSLINPTKILPPSAPVIFEPLIDATGKEITPVNTEFSIVVPKVGINAPVIASVNPSDTASYSKALKEGVAHSATSFTPDQNGTVYLFSHSTNYEWFVKDLNAVFYLVKDLLPGDTVVVFYKGVRYTYELKEKRVVKPNQISYLVPEEGKKSLILQTCWPPGSTAERLLIFADLVDTKGKQI